MLAEVRSGLRHPGNGLLPHAVGYPPAASQIQCKDESFYPRTQEDRWVEGGHAEDGRPTNNMAAPWGKVLDRQMAMPKKTLHRIRNK